MSKKPNPRRWAQSNAEFKRQQAAQHNEEYELNRLLGRQRDIPFPMELLPK